MTQKVILSVKEGKDNANSNVKWHQLNNQIASKIPDLFFHTAHRNMMAGKLQMRALPNVALVNASASNVK